MAGTNRYRAGRVLLKAASAASPCIFISHRRADKDAAEGIARYLQYVVGLDIYFDKDDEELQYAC